MPNVFNKNTRTRFALFVFTPRKWTWVDHALAMGKISLSPSFNSMEGNAVWQTAVQNMRQWTILKANMYFHGMWVLWSFIILIFHILGIVHFILCVRDTKIQINMRIKQGAPFILCLNGSREKDYRSREQAATESFALVARSYSGQLDLGPCSVSRPEFVSILLSLRQGFS